MSKQNKKSAKRVRNLIFMCSLIAIVLAASTYAWFIGMRTVNVSSFDVEIAATDSLMLSLDGKSWATTVTINKDTYNDDKDTAADGDEAVVYEGHSNNWAGRGLLPMSTIGAMDSTASRMKIFEKASLTTTPGGYRLMASRVHNYEPGNPEQDGYVVFDLFIRNFTGTQYIKALNVYDEEAIYLTNDSEVNVAAAGVADTGIENSVRVAFTQIGRVKGTTTDQGIITGITCTDDSNVTGICRIAQIWEPNDLEHVDDAIRWYETSCLKRVGEDVTKTASYTGVCGTVIDGKAYPTYSVQDDIASSDNIDIYDGKEYNGYEDTVDIFTYGIDYVPYAGNAKLVSYPYFTDSMKLLKGTKRPKFMTLAPNSITKLRIYIYIEGQDIDNYDFASIGKMISVKFGFTKERYTEDDIEYNGPDLNEGDGPDAADLTPPVIKLNGVTPMTVQLNGTYEEPGATATDNKTTIDSENDVKISGTVDTTKAGTYTILYKVTDEEGNVATKTRTVIVEE